MALPSIAFARLKIKCSSAILRIEAELEKMASDQVWVVWTPLFITESLADMIL